MCMLFLYVDNSPASDGYQLIVANNREEYYDRPTKPAGRWSNNSSCVSGLDLEPGREGGTWLGLTEAGHGRLGALLNILSESPKKCMKGRGFLVSDYLKSTESAGDYTAPLSSDRVSYNPFNLVLVEKSPPNWVVHYFSSNDESSPCDIDISKEKVHIFGNSSRQCPWKKVQDGKRIFSKIVEKYPKQQDQQGLVNSLFNMLNDPSPHWPDAQLERQGVEAELDAETTKQRSCVFVESPQIRYGTRTNSVVIVKADGTGWFIERTMRHPVNLQNPEWDTTTIEIKL